MSDTNKSLKQMYWLNGEWVYVDAENANNLDNLDSSDFASNITESRVEHSSSNMLFSNNNWSKLLYNISPDAILSASYNATHKGMAFTGVNKQYGITTRIPIDPQAIYRINARVKKINGDGNFSLGVISLDNEYTSIGNSFCVSNNSNVATIMDVSGTVSGYRLASDTNPYKFVDNASYFDIVFYTGQNGTDTNTVYVIESLEIIKTQKELYAGTYSVWHEGNFNPRDKVDHSYLDIELETRDIAINKKADQTSLDVHAGTIGGSVTSGHVKNGGNVTINNLGQMNTTPSAIGAYTKIETQEQIDTNILAHAEFVAQTGLGHVKNGGNVAIALDGKMNTSPSSIGAYSKEETDDLIAVKLTDKVYVDTHIADEVKHVTSAERTKWNAKAEANGNQATDFNAKNITVAGNIMPTGNSTQNIGSPTNRFKAIYVDEAYLSTNTLYLGDTPIIGTDADTVNIKTDPDQSICMKTSATGTTTVTSEKAVAITTSGMNSNVTIQTTGVNSQANVAATAAVNVNAPRINLTGTTTVDGDLVARNLNISGDFTVGGTMTTVNAENLVIADNIIDINKGEVGQGVSEGMAGLKIDRGDLSDVLLVFDESDDKFKIGEASNLLSLATEKYVNDNRYVHPTGTNPHGTTKTDVGLGNVTNESKATMFTSPNFTGTPIAPTAADNNNSTQLATTAFVMRESAKKANASHGDHIPAPQIANPLSFLRNDNTWQVIQSATTSQKGVVQLNNNIDSDATDQAATASAVKTTYDYASTKATKDTATTTIDGLMSKTDKAKLDSIAEGAGTNQNAFSYFKVGSATVSADNATDTVELVAGNGITLTADTATDKITITGVNQYTHPTGDGNLHVPANGTSNNGKFLQATSTAGTYQWASLPVGNTTSAGILQLGTGASQASPGNHGHSYLPLSGGTLTGRLSLPGYGLPSTTSASDNSVLYFSADNNAMTFGLHNTFNSRQGWIQVRHSSDSYATAYGTLSLNPLGGAVTINNCAVYHTGNKPTLPELGAAPVNHEHNNYSLSTHNHDSDYLKLTGGTINGKLIVLGTAASESFMARGIQGSDGNGNAGELYLNYNNNNPVYINGSNKVYHQGFKPTCADIGAAETGHIHTGYLAIDGGTLTGTLTMPADKYWISNKTSAINMRNSDMIGVNCIVFADECDSIEGLLFPKAGKSGDSNIATDFDILKSYQSVLYYNTNKVYHEGYKPTLADIGAASSSHNHDSSYATISHSHTTLNSTIPVKVLNATSAQKMATGGIVTSDNYDTDIAKIPANGIYAKGNIHTDGEVKIKNSGVRYNASTECIEFYFV